MNQPSRQELDSLVRKVFNDLRTALDNLGELKNLIDGYTAEQLAEAGAGFEYAADDVNNLKAFVFQHPLVLATQPMTDALTFGGRLAGLNLVRR